MQLDQPFRVVTPTVDGDVLTALARVDAELTPPQVRRVIGRRSEAGVRKALDRLAEQGVVQARRAGQAWLYRLNRDHLAAEAVTTLASQGDRLVERLRQRLATWDPGCVHAALFGSAARGGMRVDSDIDLFVVRPDTVDADDERWRSQLAELARDVTAWTGNDTRLLEYGAQECRTGRAAGERVLEDIAVQGIALVGPDRYL